MKKKWWGGGGVKMVVVVVAKGGGGVKDTILPCIERARRKQQAEETPKTSEAPLL
jgi:hypothetical protein